MHLGIDALRLRGRRVGVGRYIEYLLREWSASEQPFATIRAYVPGPLEHPVEVADPVRLTILDSRWAPAAPRLWEHLYLPIAKPRDDLLFCPGYVVPVLAREQRLVVTHLGSYEALPGTFSRWQAARARWQYQNACRRADRVITVSESSRRDILRFYRIPEAKVEVIPLGVDAAFRPLDDPPRLAACRRQLIGDDRPFVLFVGKLSRRRHIPELVAAFGRLRRRRRLDHVLLLIGPNLLGHDLAGLAAHHGVAGAVKHLPYADHDLLVTAYNAADSFIYPSAYEGFGMPVLESMACGTPTVTLDNSAFPEFASGIALLAADAAPATLEAALDTALHDRDFRARARRAGPRRAEHYRWPAIARRTMDVLATVAGGAPGADPR